jgi:glycolate oxidase iron-sulfur subunit
MDLTLTLEKPREDQYLNCIRCGLCLSVCPTYREELKETASPRGRVALARKGLEGELELSPNLVEQMYSCFACMACYEICPVGINPAELILEMRYIQEQVNPKAWKKGLFEKLLPIPKRLELATLPLRLYEKTGLRRLVYWLGLYKLLPAKLRDLEAMLPRIPQRPLRQVLPPTVKARGEEKYKVGFFLGCAQSLIFADQSSATVNVLAHNGCTVTTPREVQCCGMPALGYGRMDLVRAQARHNIAQFENLGVDKVITDCATCGSTLKEYGKYLKNDPEWAERAGKFSSSVRDISEFLREIPLKKPTGRVEQRVTYHDPCHLRRGQGVWQQPRDLLNMIEGLEFVEMPEADTCCGSAGSQLITHYKTSSQVIERKAELISTTGAAVVASGCPGCQMQLLTGLKKQNLDLRVVHPVTLLNEAYGEADE